MYDVIAIFPQTLTKTDIQSIKALTEAKKLKRRKIIESDVADFCRIALECRNLSALSALEIFQCNTLTTLMMSSWKPIYCVRLDIGVLDTTSYLGQNLSIAEHVLHPLRVVQGTARQAQRVREILQFPVDNRLIDLIDNELIPIFERQLEELTEYCRWFYAKRAHTES